MDKGTLERMADLVVEFGANVQPGQRVHVGAAIGQEGLARAIAARCYRAGAVFVHVAYSDPWVQKARLDDAVDEALGYEPGWIVQMIREHGEERGASIGLSGPVAPGLLDGADPDRIRRDVPPGRKESLANMTAARLTWSGTNTGELFGRPPTHRFARATEIEIVRIEDGRIVEVRQVADVASLMAQLEG